MMTYVYTTFLMIVGAGCVFGSITFINGTLLPETLAGVYEFLDSRWYRWALALVTFSALVSIVVPYAVRLAGPQIAFPIWGVVVVFAGIVTPILLKGTPANPVLASIFAITMMVSTFGLIKSL